MYQRRPEEGTESPEARVTGDYNYRHASLPDPDYF